MADITPGLNTLDDDEKPVATGAAVKATGKGLSPVGTIAMDPTQTEELLANMQSMVNERTGALSTFERGLQRASAWGSGRDQGPAAALAQLDQQKLAEDRELFNMRQQMAALRSSAAQQKAFNERKQAELTGGAPTGGAGAPSAPGMRQSVFDQMPAEIKRALSNARTQEEWNSIYNPYAQKMAQIQAQFKYNPATYENKIKFVDPKTGELDYIDAETAKRYKEMGYGDRIIMPTSKPSTTKAPADTLSAIKTGIFNQESLGGKLDTSKPNYAGAVGPMQILPDTFEGLKKEGLIPQNYDINNPQHNKAAGDALIDKYYKQYKGDPDKVMAAYYGGPGAIKADGTIDVNRRDPRNPNAPTVGEYIAQAKQKAGLTTAPAEVAVGAPQRKTIPQAEVELKGIEAKEVAAGTASGKYIGGKEAEILEAGSTSGTRLASIVNIEKYVTDPRTNRVFGVFEKPGFWNGVGALVQSAVKAGNYSIGITDFDKLIASTMKDASQAEKDAAQIVGREFAKMKLQEAKVLLAGQGAVSDAERGLIAELTGSRLNSPGAIKEYLAWGKMRAEYDQKVGDSYDTWKGSNPRGNFDQYRVTKEARALREDYNNRMMDFANSVNIDMGKAKNVGASLNEKDRSGNSVVMGTGEAQSSAAKPAASPFVYKDADKEKRYQLYLQQRGSK
jgi:hypothetical protein